MKDTAVKVLGHTGRFAGGLALLALFLLTLVLLGSCGQGVVRQSPGPGDGEARLEENRVIAEDGYRLPLRHWRAKGESHAIVLGVHGFNDHGGSFRILAEALVPHGIEVYAHDQRGFGTTAQRGLWHGHERLADDVTLIARLLRERHPGPPLYLVGKSMGATVVILALTGDTPPPVDGNVLISPAVWGFETMPWYQRLGLWLGVRFAPGMRFSARLTRRLGIEPTDDPEIKEQLAQDPLILRHARLDTLHGLSLAMDAALQAARRLPTPALILYGDEDDIIPPEAICALLAQLPEDDAIRLALYPQGYHMLTRYTKRERTEADIIAWLSDPAAPLPSGHEVERREARRALCDA